MPCQFTKDGWVILKNSDKKWSTAEGNGKSLQYSFHVNTMNNMKKQKDTTLEDEPPDQKVSNMSLGTAEGNY